MLCNHVFNHTFKYTCICQDEKEEGEITESDSEPEVWSASKRRRSRRSKYKAKGGSYNGDERTRQTRERLHSCSDSVYAKWQYHGMQLVLLVASQKIGIYQRSSHHAPPPIPPSIAPPIPAPPHIRSGARILVSIDT